MDTNVVVAIGSNMVGSKQHGRLNWNKDHTQIKIKDNQFSGASPEPLPKGIFGCPFFMYGAGLRLLRFFFLKKSFAQKKSITDK